MSIRDLAAAAADAAKQQKAAQDRAARERAVRSLRAAATEWCAAHLLPADEVIVATPRSYCGNPSGCVYVRIEDVWLVWHASPGRYFSSPPRADDPGCLLIDEPPEDYLHVHDSYSHVIRDLVSLGQRLPFWEQTKDKRDRERERREARARVVNP